MKKKIISEALLKKFIRNKLIENFQKKLLKENSEFEQIQYDVFTNAIESINVINDVQNKIKKKNINKLQGDVIEELTASFFNIKACLSALLFLQFILPEAVKKSVFKDNQDFDVEDIQNRLQSGGQSNLNAIISNLKLSEDSEIIKKIKSKKYYDIIWNAADNDPEDDNFITYFKTLVEVCKDAHQLITSSNIQFLFSYNAWLELAKDIEAKMKSEGKWLSIEDSCFTMEEIEILDHDFWVPLTIDKSEDVIIYIADNLFRVENSLKSAGLTDEVKIDQAFLNITSGNNSSSNVTANNGNASNTVSNKTINDDNDTKNAIQNNLNILLNTQCKDINDTKKVGLIFTVLHSLTLDEAFNALTQKMSDAIVGSTQNKNIKAKLKDLINNTLKGQLKVLSNISIEFFKEYDKVQDINAFNALVTQKKQKMLESIYKFPNVSIVGLLLKNQEFINQINSKLNDVLPQIATKTVGFVNIYIEYYNKAGAKDIAIPVNVVNQYGAIYKKGKREIDNLNAYEGAAGFGLKPEIIKNINNLTIDSNLINELDPNLFKDANTATVAVQEDTPVEVTDGEEDKVEDFADDQEEGDTVADTKPADADISDEQWKNIIKLVQDIQDGKKKLPPKLIDQLQGLLNKKGISKEEIKSGLDAQQNNVQQEDTDPLKDIFRVPQLNGGYFELAKILMSTELLANYKNGNFQKKKYETAKAYGFIEKKGQELNSVETFFSTPDKIFNSLGLKLSSTALNKLTTSLNDSKKIGQLLNDYFDKKMLKVNEYLLIDGDVFMYITLRLLEDLGLESDNFNELHKEYVVQKDPIVIKASAQLNGDIFKQLVDLNKRISISQMLNNRSIKNKKSDIESKQNITTKSYEMKSDDVASQKNAYRIIQGQQGKDFKSELATIMSDAAMAFTSAHRQRIEELAEDFILDAYKTKEIKSVAELDRLKDLVNNTIDIKYGKQIPDKTKQQINQKIKNLWKGNITTVKRQ